MIQVNGFEQQPMHDSIGAHDASSVSDIPVDTRAEWTSSTGGQEVGKSWSSAYEKKAKRTAKKAKKSAGRTDTATAVFSAAGDLAVHSVFKSYVPGKGYVSAAKVGAKALKKVPRGRYEDMKGVSAADEVKRDKMTGANEGLKRLYHSGTVRQVARGNKKTGVAAVEIADEDMPAGLEAFATNMGGRNKQARKPVMFHKKGASSEVLTHEMAHATPKRSQSRLYDVVNTPAKQAKEEARADMANGSHWRKPVPEGKFRSGYHEAAQETKPRRAQAMRAGMGKIGENNLNAMISGNKAKPFAPSSRENMWQRRNMQGFRNTQDKIHTAQTGEKLRSKRVPAFTRNEKIAGTGAAVGTGAWVENKHRRGQGGKFVSKGFPDQADMHIVGTGKMKKVSRPRYQDAIRRK